MAHSWPKLHTTHIPTHMYINTMSTTYISCPLKSARYVTSIRTEMPPTFASYPFSCLISSTYSCNNPWPRFPNDHTASLSLKFSAQLHKWFRWSVVSPIGDLSKVPGLDLAQTYWLALTWSSRHTRATFIFADNQACAITLLIKSRLTTAASIFSSLNLELVVESTKILTLHISL